MVKKALITFLGLCLLWQIFVIIFHMPPYLLPSPLLVSKALFNNAGIILKEAIPTLGETLLGFFFSIIIGSFAALSLLMFRPARQWLLPLLLISQALPTFAIAPLLVVWFGYGLTSKIITTMIMVFFPITSSFYDGLKRTETGWLDLSKTMGASTWRTLLYIRIPAALPAFASGLRTASAIAPLGAIIGEWVGSSEGLGYLLLNANARLEIDVMFACLFSITLLTLGLYFLVDRTLRKLIPWQSENLHEQ